MTIGKSSVMSVGYMYNDSGMSVGHEWDDTVMIGGRVITPNAQKLAIYACAYARPHKNHPSTTQK